MGGFLFSIIRYLIFYNKNEMFEREPIQKLLKKKILMRINTKKVFDAWILCEIKFF